MQRLASLNSHTGINAARLLKIALEAAQQHSESPPKRLWPCVDSSKYIPWNPFSIFSRVYAIHIWISTCIQAILCQPFQNSPKIKDTRNNISLHCILWHHCANYDSQVSVSICFTISLQAIANVAQHEHILRKKINFTQTLLQWRIWVLWYMVKKETSQISSCTPCIPQYHAGSLWATVGFWYDQWPFSCQLCSDRKCCGQRFVRFKGGNVAWPIVIPCQ